MREKTIIDISEIEADELPVMEAFYTIQGEGYHQGKAAYFIRLAGCDVGCVWCDVKESWDKDLHPLKKISDIAGDAASFPGRLAVITGGEPTLYNLEYLTGALKEKGFATNIETSGSHPITGYWDWICLSPKKFKAPLPQNMSRADELKVIVFNKSDFDWAEKHARLVSPQCRLYLQPEWSRAGGMTPLIVDYVKRNPQWQISVQVHKYIDVP